MILQPTFFKPSYPAVDNERFVPGMRKGLRFICYADDFSIYTESKAASRAIGNVVYVFLRDQLYLPINRKKSGMRRPLTFKVLYFNRHFFYSDSIPDLFSLFRAKRNNHNYVSRY